MEEVTPSHPECNKGKSPRPFLRSAKEFFATTTNGMAIGLFGTLIIGTIIGLFAKIPNLESIGVIANVIKGLMGAGIGLGVALSLKLNGVQLVSLMAAGALGNLAFDFFKPGIIVINDPLCCYVSALIAYVAVRYLHPKRTPVDLILIPLLALALATAFTYTLSYWVHYVTVGIGKLIELSFNAVPYLMDRNSIKPRPGTRFLTTK